MSKVKTNKRKSKDTLSGFRSKIIKIDDQFPSENSVFCCSFIRLLLQKFHFSSSVVHQPVDCEK